MQGYMTEIITRDGRIVFATGKEDTLPREAVTVTMTEAFAEAVMEKISLSRDNVPGHDEHRHNAYMLLAEPLERMRAVGRGNAYHRHIRRLRFMQKKLPVLCVVLTAIAAVYVFLPSGYWRYFAAGALALWGLVGVIVAVIVVVNWLRD